MVLSNMVREMSMPIEVVLGETVRAADGLALSSRNGYLSADERARAPLLYRLLNRIGDAVRAGDHDLLKLETDAMAEPPPPAGRLDYIAVRRRADLQPPCTWMIRWWCWLPPNSHRLIDNLEI